jgi:probable rRNA maturation factor
MVLHGFLHLLGYDHEVSQAGARRMFAIQDRLWDRLLKRRS